MMMHDDNECLLVFTGCFNSLSPREVAWNSVLPTSARASVTAGDALEWKTDDQFHCQFELLNQVVYFPVVLSYLAGTRTFRKLLSTTVCDDAN